MQIIDNFDINTVDTVLKRPELSSGYLSGTINNVLQRVKSAGNEAVRSLTEQFDKVKLTELRVGKVEIEAAQSQVPKDLQEAIITAKNNIEKFHTAQQKPTVTIETMPGVVCWRKSVPIQNVGLYIPGGSAPLFSTVLMLGVPAAIAGCNNVVLCTPPDREGNINPAILFTANLVGIKNIFKIGGAQAIAAMAYGTESIPKVDKIFGPGNQYVTKAKQMVNLEGTAIDMPAGPSEVAIIADETSNPEFIAADLLSQAEHGEDSQVILISTSLTIVEATLKAIDTQLERLPRKEIALKCLQQSKAIVTKNSEESVAVSNAYAPEHLIICCDNAVEIANQITQAGSVFIGPFTPESAGDYASGTNHTLPTNGAARAYSGVSLDSFVKDITFQQISAQGIKNLGPVVEKMAEAEQLVAHKNAISVRLNQLGR